MIKNRREQVLYIRNMRCNADRLRTSLVAEQNKYEMTSKEWGEIAGLLSELAIVDYELNLLGNDIILLSEPGRHIMIEEETE